MKYKIVRSIPKPFCQITTTTECHYPSYKECGCNKKTCLKYRQQKDKQFSLSRSIVLMCIGLLLFLVCFFASKSTIFEGLNITKDIFNVLSTVSISFFAAALFAVIIDLPSKLNDYRNAIIQAITSNEYLDKLDELSLGDLRQNITENLHTKGAAKTPRELLDFDKHICTWLKEPYYVRYRQIIHCTESLDHPGHFKKKVEIEYKVVNPYGKVKPTKEIIKLKSLVSLKNWESNGNEIIDLPIITCMADDGSIKNYSDKVKWDICPIDRKHEYYDTSVKIVSKEPDSDGKIIDGLYVEYVDNLKVHISYEIFISMDDVCFTKRLQRPTKNFRLDYFSNIPNTKLHGQLFGTNLKQEDATVRYSGNQHISIETFGWLLPNNGALVVIAKKE